MKIILHRAQEKTEQLMDKYKNHEVDVRMICGELMCAHNHGKTGTCRFEDYKEVFEPELLAINIKEDGLIPLITEKLRDHSNFYFFDMSIPETIKAVRDGYPVAFRISDVETITPFKVHWLPLINKNVKLAFWCDCFNKNFEGQLKQLEKLKLIFNSTDFPNTKFFVVSPDLHKCEVTKNYIDKLKSFGDDVYICTGKPEVFEE